MTADTASFLDFRRAPASRGLRNPAEHDFTQLAPGEGRCLRFIFSIDPAGEGTCTVRAQRSPDGTLTVTAEPARYEPVTEDGKLVGLRFPGCDRYPWQP